MKMYSFNRKFLLTGALFLFSTVSMGIHAESGAKFSVTVENINQDVVPIAWSSGLWFLGSQPNPLFIPDAPILNNGLEALAEDGNPTAMQQSLGAGSGTFGPSLLLPGQMISFEILAMPGEELSLASKLAETNDIFISNNQPIQLFDGAGQPLSSINASSSMRLWDAGTEANQAPRQGPDQPPRQMTENQGAEEGSLRIFSDSTRAMPRVDRFLDFSVSQKGNSFNIEVLNVADSPIDGLGNIPIGFWVLSNAQHQFFDNGMPAMIGLEEFSEDGDNSIILLTLGGDPDVGSAAAVNPIEGTTNFLVTPTTKFDHLNLAFYVLAGNDIFIASATPIPLLVDGSLLPTETVRQSLLDQLQIWDAGTEANEALGLGGNQALNQSFPGQGPADPVNIVRPYRDSTNDLAGPLSPGKLGAFVGQASGALEFSVDRISQSSEMSFILLPLLVIRHSSGTPLSNVGPVAYADWFEQGIPTNLIAELQNLPSVISVSTVNPSLPGEETFDFQITPSGTNAEYLSLASIIVTSNDAFMALPPDGIAITNPSGVIRPLQDIEADLNSGLMAWDAGVEANQPGGVGINQLGPGRLPGGPTEGSGIVRLVDDPVWRYPAPSDSFQVTLEFIDTIVFADEFE